MKNPNMESNSEAIVQISQDIDLDGLYEKLRTARIPVGAYGKGAAKTVLDLLSEVNEGESALTISPNKTIQRMVRVASINVFCALECGDVYRLKEEKQVFTGGRTKIRELDTSIGEKIKPFETAENAAVRALSEELGITEIDATNDSGCQVQSARVNTFPGIESTYEMHKFDVIIPESVFVPEGYIEKQETKTNYYGWELVYGTLG